MSMPMSMLLVKSFLTLFVIIDPIGLAPIFMALTEKQTPEEQAKIARRAVLVAAAILVVFGLVGNWLLRYLGITIEAFEVASGILLFKIALDMVFAQRERETPEEEKEAQMREDISIFPLAIPLIAGPGTLASILILASDADVYSLGLLMVLGVAALVLVIAYALLYYSHYLAEALGKTGINVITRILGVLLTALAVQYIADGTGVLLKTIFPG